jgi:hypothetical protein
MTQGGKKYLKQETMLSTLANSLPLAPLIEKDVSKALGLPSPVFKAGAFGEIQSREMMQWYLPATMKPVTEDKYEIELERLGVYPGLPQRYLTINGERQHLKADAYLNYCLAYGKASKEALVKAMDVPQYVKMSDERKVELLGKMLDRAHEGVTTKAKIIYRAEQPK